MADFWIEYNEQHKHHYLVRHHGHVRANTNGECRANFEGLTRIKNGSSYECHHGDQHIFHFWRADHGVHVRCETPGFDNDEFDIPWHELMEWVNGYKEFLVHNGALGEYLFELAYKIDGSYDRRMAEHRQWASTIARRERRRENLKNFAAIASALCIMIGLLVGVYRSIPADPPPRYDIYGHLIPRDWHEVRSKELRYNR